MKISPCVHALATHLFAFAVRARNNSTNVCATHDYLRYRMQAMYKQFRTCFAIWLFENFLCLRPLCLCNARQPEHEKKQRDFASLIKTAIFAGLW